MCDSVTPLKGEAAEGKPIRVTGVVEPYDESKLECAYGVNLEGREKHLSKSPILMIKKPQTAKLEETVIIVLPPPAPAPMPEAEAAPAPEPAPPAPPAVTEHKALPRTAGEIPLLGIGGLFALGAAFVIRRFRTE